MSQETKDYALLHFLVLIWGFTAILGVVITIPPVEMVFYRTLFASLGLMTILIVRKKSFQFHKGSDYLVSIGNGVLIAAHWILFFLSARVSNVSVCLAGMATCSLWTSFLEPLSKGNRVKVFEVVLGIIAFVGIAIIVKAEFDHIFGLILAILSALLSAIFTIVNGRLIGRSDPFVITFYQMGAAVTSIALFFPFYLQLDGVGFLQLSLSWSDFGYLFLLGMICTVFAYSYSVRLMKRLSAFSINLTVNLEPVYGIILALVFFPERETMTSGFYLGTFLILLSVLTYPIVNRRVKRVLKTDLLR